MKKLIFETGVKVLKNTYTTVDSLPDPWVKSPVMKKVIFGTEIKTPTSYRIYEYSNGISSRVWVFGDIEINPSKFNIKKVSI